MNKRILELAEESGMTQYVAAHNKYLERFAVAIVEECLEQVKSLRHKYDTHRDIEPEENDWYIDAFLQAEEKIKEHFGVKE